jgi:hypothetical protein
MEFFAPEVRKQALERKVVTRKARKQAAKSKPPRRTRKA